MKFLVDECIGPEVARQLSKRKHDVFSVYQEARGADDDWIIKKACEEDRIIVTGDKVVSIDFSHIWVSADSLNNPRIYRSSDGGETWLRTNGALGWGLDFVDTLYGWAGGEYSGYFLTQDGGETYEQYENNGLGYICGIDLVDRKHGWAAAYYPLTFERNRGEVHRWIPDTSGIHEIEDDYNTKTAIIFCTDRVSLGKGRYSIYDNTGSLVKVISNYWNGDDNKGETVPPGIYFGKQREKTVRIIKIK